MQGTSTTLDANPQSPLPAEKKFGWAKAIAIFTIALGLSVLGGWVWNIDVLKSPFTGMVVMKVNAATAFILSGICLYLHTLHQLSPSALIARRLGASLVLLLGLVTLSEDFLGWDAGIDQLLFHEPAGAALTAHPGRMAVIAAMNFALIGAALLLVEARLWMTVQAMASAVAVFSLLSLGGYMFGNLSFTRIGNTTAIAVHAAMGFLALAIGILMATKNHGFMLRLRGKSRVIGLAASLLMLISIFGAATYDFVQKSKASQWVEHTYEIIQGMESFSNSLHDFLYHNRGFMLTGDDRQLVERDKRRDAMLAELARVHQLTSHNALQQERLEALNKLVGQRMERANMAVQVRREKGPEAAAAMVSSGKGDTLLDEIEAKLDELEDTEKDLLKQRQKIAEVMRSSSLFTLSVLLGVSLLLLLWVFRTTQREITERKRMGEELAQREALLRNYFDLGQIGMAITSLEHGWLRVNNRLCEMLGYTREELVNMTWSELTYPDDLEPDMVQFRKLMSGEIERYSMDKRFIRKDGSIIHTYLAVSCQRKPDGSPDYVIASLQDITERKQAEAALRASEKRLHAIIQNSMDAMVQMDAEGFITGWNSQMEKVFGWSREEATGRALHETIIPPQQRAAHERGLKHFLHTGEGPVLNKRIEVESLRRDGHAFPVELTVTSIKMGDKYEFSAFLRDISERKRQENVQAARLRLMQSAARLSLKELLVATLDEACALTGSPIGFYHFLEADQQTLTLQAWSTRTTREFCKAQGEGAHYGIAEAGVWVDCVRERRPMIHNDYAALPHKRGMPPGHAHVEREMVVPIFRKELIVAILGVGNKTAPYDDNDLESVIQLADIAWDIAEAKHAEEEIRRLNAELEQRVVERTAKLEAANKDMESFSYSISHDLRAPLRAINGFSKILQEDYIDRLDEEGRRLLNVVGDNAQKMGELIDDILAFSRAGRNEINRTVIDMEKMVAGVWEELKPDMTGRNVHLELRDMPQTKGDAAMMRQVIFNLVENAVKFTQHNADARIEVGGQANEQETIYHVKDNGVGFDMQYADKLFGAFQRLHQADEFEGTGIGLAIVKRIIAKHGGRVWAEGKVGEGATIYFALPKE